MFVNRWFARAAASHWLSPSVSMPTRRYIESGSAILIRVAERDVPGFGIFVEPRRDIDAVDLDHELHRRFHLKVTRTAQDSTKPRMRRKHTDLVRVRPPRLSIDPIQQRPKGGLV